MQLPENEFKVSYSMSYALNCKKLKLNDEKYHFFRSLTFLEFAG